MNAPPAEPVRFGPAVDPWVVGVLAFAGLAMVVATVAVALDPGVGIEVLLLVVAIDALAGGAVVALAYPIAYFVDADAVRVRAGVMRYRVALAELKRVAFATSLVSSTTAAWTFRRVQLLDRRGRVLEVGPADRVGFVAEVLARAPHLVEEPGAARARAWHDPTARRS